MRLNCFASGTTGAHGCSCIFFVPCAGWHFFGAADPDLGSYYDDSAAAICAAVVY